MIYDQISSIEMHKIILLAFICITIEVKVNLATSSEWPLVGRVTTQSKCMQGSKCRIDKECGKYGQCKQKIQNGRLKKW